MSDIAAARERVSQLEQNVEQLTHEAKELDARREQIQTSLRERQQQLAQARADVARIEREPADLVELSASMSRLRARLAKSDEYPGDAKSPTRARVARELDALEEDDRASAVEKLGRVAGLWQAFSDRYKLDRDAFDAREARNFGRTVRSG